MADKIQMKTIFVEVDGDEMTRVMWAMVKDNTHLAGVISELSHFFPD